MQDLSRQIKKEPIVRSNRSSCRGQNMAAGLARRIAVVRGMVDSYRGIREMAITPGHLQKVSAVCRVDCPARAPAIFDPRSTVHAGILPINLSRVASNWTMHFRRGHYQTRDRDGWWNLSRLARCLCSCCQGLTNNVVIRMVTLIRQLDTP
jgi:hypothetical protein